MKKLSCILSILLIVFVSSCSNENESLQKDFSIKDSNGKVILPHARVLKITTEIGKEKFGDVDIILIDIKTIHKKDKYSSLVEYKTSTGNTGNLMISNGNNETKSQLRVGCNEWVLKCSGSCCSLMSDDISSGIYKCGCNGTPSGTSCSMTYKCINQE
jgi:hypothetical protein